MTLLRAPAVDQAAEELSAALKAVGAAIPPLAVRQAMVRRTVKAYLAAAADLPPPMAATLHPRTRLLLGMKVGDQVHWPKTENASVWHNSFTTARRQLGEPKARWSRTALADGDRITRLADGAHRAPFDPSRNQRAVTIAKMGVGTRLVVTPADWKCAGAPLRLDVSVKVAARRILDDARADWRYRLLGSDRGRMELRRIS